MAHSFIDDNTAYEAWLHAQCDVVRKDLKHKHKRMKKNSFVFLRATYFRWAKRIEKLCADLVDAPAVLSVGDTHIENFGTWRDAEGRWVWGVNDFDEAATIPYPFDLVRLATSVRLSPKAAVRNREASDAILDGYRAGLADPRPILLDQQATPIRAHAACTDKDCSRFWKEVDSYPDATPPMEVKRDLKAAMPDGAVDFRWMSRRKGGGSLGRPRFVAIATWRGGCVVREAKALVPSAWDWAHGSISAQPRFLDLAQGRFRAPDPFLRLGDRFIVRRIAPDARKIEFGSNAGAELDFELLRAMGTDLGAIHAAARGGAERISTNLEARKADWLYEAAITAADAVEQDYAEWKEL